MKHSIKRSLGIMLVGAALVAVPVTNAVAQDSGFMKDYSKLKMVKDSEGVERRVWISEKLTRENYKAVLLEPVTFYPKEQPNEQVSLSALNDIRAYIDAALRETVTASLPTAPAAGPGIARVRVALTAASVNKDLKAYQLIPVAFVFTMAKRAAGATEYPVKLYVEAEITDSVTGEVLSQMVREAQGIQVKGNEQVTLAMARPYIDRWKDAANVEIVRRFGPTEKPAAK
jgi:hypothetical protein